MKSKGLGDSIEKFTKATGLNTGRQNIRRIKYTMWM